jgi:hypothetical protein
VSFTNNQGQVNFPVANASASINNTGALINVNAIRYNYISEKLKEYWSPEQIMGRLELDKKIPTLTLSKSGKATFVSFTNNQVNFPVSNARASINNTGALINVNDQTFITKCMCRQK